MRKSPLFESPAIMVLLSQRRFVFGYSLYRGYIDEIYMRLDMSVLLNYLLRVGLALYTSPATGLPASLFLMYISYIFRGLVNTVLCFGMGVRPL